MSIIGRRRFELLEGEHVLVDEPIHWKNYVMPFLAQELCLFLILLRDHFPNFNVLNYVLGRALVPTSFQPVISVVEIVVLWLLALVCFVRMLEISYIRYYLTDIRIISVSGIINRRFSEMLLVKCEMVYLTQSMYGRLFSCGDILCVGAGSQLYLDDVKHVINFMQELMGRIAAREGVHPGRGYAAGAMDDDFQGFSDIVMN